MHIVVPIKQVPQTSDVQMDPKTGTMIRSGTTSILNPLDVYALEAALELKDRLQATVAVISMGPPSAEKVLKQALAMGCDEAYLLTDRAFAGSDTWATSYTLSQAIRQMGPVDLIITGERATDGDTAQVGPALAAWMDLPIVSYVAKLEQAMDSSLICDRLTEEGYQRVQVMLPAVLTVVKEIATPRLPTLRGKKKAMRTPITTLTAQDLKANASYLGLGGSPTKVVKIATPKVGRTCKIVHAEDENLEQAIDELLVFLDEGVQHA